MKSGITRWKADPLKWRGWPDLPRPFSPVHKQRKFSAVFGATSARSSMVMRPAGVPPMVMSSGFLPRRNPRKPRKPKKKSVRLQQRRPLGSKPWAFKGCFREAFQILSFKPHRFQSRNHNANALQPNGQQFNHLLNQKRTVLRLVSRELVCKVGLLLIGSMECMWWQHGNILSSKKLFAIEQRVARPRTHIRRSDLPSIPPVRKKISKLKERKKIFNLVLIFQDDALTFFSRQIGRWFTTGCFVLFFARWKGGGKNTIVKDWEGENEEMGWPRNYQWNGQGLFKPATPIQLLRKESDVHSNHATWDLERRRSSKEPWEI